MKRKLALILLLCLIMRITVQADVIWEPPPNDFLIEHLNECERRYRRFIVNSPEGGACLYYSPDGAVSVEYLENGTEVFSQFSYGDGAWLLTAGTELGWLEAENAVAVYDYISFQEEYSGSFYWDETVVQQLLESFQATSTVYVYDYPGSGNGLNMSAKFMLEESDGYNIVDLFLDENGLVWGRMGDELRSYSWICVSCPMSKTLPVIERQTIELYPAEVQGIHDGVLAACLVTGVAAVSLVLIFLIHKKKKAAG